MNNNNLIGKIFEDASGNVVSVRDIDGVIAHLDTGQRVSVERLLDSSFYNESIDPNLFSNKENNFYTFLGNQIKSIDIDRAGTLDAGVQIHGINTVVESHADAQRSLTGEYNPSHSEYEEIEARKREIARNATNIGNSIQSTNSKLKELIGDDDSIEDIQINRNLEGIVMDNQPRETSVTMFDENNSKVDSYNSHDIPSRQPVNPIYTMFAQVKRDTNFSLNVKLIEKIPRKDFLKMWEESYEISIIDYLVDEFTEKLLKDPTMIKDQLSSALHKHIYGKSKTPIKTQDSTPIKKVTRTKTTRVKK